MNGLAKQSSATFRQFANVGLVYVAWVYLSIYIADVGFVLSGAKYRIGVYFLILTCTWVIVWLRNVRNSQLFLTGAIPSLLPVLIVPIMNPRLSDFFFFAYSLASFSFYAFVCGTLATTARGKLSALLIGVSALLVQGFVDFWVGWERYGNFRLV